MPAERLLACSTAALVLVAIAPSSSGQSCSIPGGSYESRLAGQMNVYSYGIGGASTYPDAIQAAMNQWNSTCDVGRRGDIPELVTGGSNMVSASIFFYSGRNDGRVQNCGTSCGCSRSTIMNGSLYGGEISIFEYTAGLLLLVPGQPRALEIHPAEVCITCYGTTPRR